MFQTKEDIPFLIVGISLYVIWIISAFIRQYDIHSFELVILAFVVMLIVILPKIFRFINSMRNYWLLRLLKFTLMIKRRFIPLSLEKQNVFQVDEAAFKNQDLLWEKWTCCLKSNLDCAYHLLFAGFTSTESRSSGATHWIEKIASDLFVSGLQAGDADIILDN